MTVFEKLKTKDIDELAEWLDKNCYFDNSPWVRYWDKNYCKNCESISGNGFCLGMEHFCGWHEFAYCEVHGNCRYFQDMEDVPDCKMIIKLWLESET